jgi:hypothetical protein
MPLQASLGVGAADSVKTRKVDDEVEWYLGEARGVYEIRDFHRIQDDVGSATGMQAMAAATPYQPSRRDD